MNKETELLYIQLSLQLRSYLISDVICLIHELSTLLHNQIKYNFYTSDSESHPCYESGIKNCNPYVCGNWIGRYTIGNVDCRETKLWLRTIGALSFDFHIGYNNEDKKRRFYDALEKAENPSPGDYCNFTHKSLEELISYLKNEKVCELTEMNYYVHMKSKGILDKCMLLHWDTSFYDDVMSGIDKIEKHNRLKNEKKFKIIVNTCPLDKVWLVFKLDEIIEELHEVLRECNSHNVR